MSKFKKYFLVFIFIIFIAFLFRGSLSLQNTFYNTVDFFNQYFKENKILGLIIFTGLAAASASLSPFSSIPLAPVAIMIWGNALTFIMLVTGWLIGDIIAYFIGSYASHSIIKKLFSFEKINNYAQKIPPRAKFWLVLFFRLAMPSEIGGYALGIIRYNFLKYILATFLAEVPFAITAVYAGEAFLKKEPLLFIALIIPIALLIASAFYAIQRRFQIHN